MSCWKTFSCLKSPCKILRSRSFSTSTALRNQHSCKLLVVGGGAGGCSIAAKYASKLGKNRVIIIDPADRHYYQAMFTMIGGGMKKLNQSYKPMDDVLPKDALWLKDTVTEIDPKKNEVTTEKGDTVKYEYMVVATGIELDFDKIPGLIEGLKDQRSGVCSNYSPLYVTKTYGCIQRLDGGNAVFTYPNSPVKCAGAPQKIAYITADYMQRYGRRNVKVLYNTALPVIFKAPKYATSLWKVAEKRKVKVNLNVDLVEVRPDKKEAVFKSLSKPDETYVQEYQMLHVCPPQCPTPMIAKNKELSDSTGFLNVHKGTLQHVKYSNIFGIGDCTTLPTSKTAAAVAGQLGVLRRNLSAAMEGKTLTATYDGYTSCPLVTGYGSCIMAEFDYDSNPLETFPFDQGVERRTMFHMKKDVMPQLYFNLMLRGLWEGPGIFRKIMHLGLSK